MTIRTKVKQELGAVIEGFNSELFLKLNPPFPKVRLARFDGCATGDLVSLELNFLLFKQTWTSEITEDHSSEKEFYFIDQGTELPFFFKAWKHKHILTDEEGGTLITDAIEYKTPFMIFDWFMYPLLYLQFIYRAPIYRRVFG